MTHTPVRSACRLAGVGLLAFLALPMTAWAQSATTPPAQLSLADALSLAEQRSQALKIAEAGLQRAQGQRYQARAQFFPQLNGTAGYQRTLESQFQAISKSAGSSSNDSTSGGSTGGSSASDTSSNSGNDLASSPLAKIFAAPNTVTLGVQFTQNLFTAGKLTAAKKGAEAVERAALAGVATARAQLVIDVAQAYYNAVAADRMAAIADSALAQADRALRQTELARQVGSTAEFDLLRARVTRDNARPQAIQARTSRDIAYLRLRQMLGLSLNGPMTLTSSVRDNLSAEQAMGQTAASVLMGPVVLPRANTSATPDTSVEHRAAVRQAADALEAQRYALRAANWQRLPSVQFSSGYQRFGYPREGTLLPSAVNQFYPNWTATLGFSFPIFTGGRLMGEKLVAQANFAEAQQRLLQAREAAELDARMSISQYEQAQATYAASVGTDEQAAKAYQIAEVRYQEGISTQLELDQSRTQLQQARINRVNAARDFEIARLRLALLRDLPIGGATTGAVTTGGMR
ncbi:MAG: TolC family protein [Gemmatimonadota bacterium]|nr:TolC family protein [Gemmatimonadota bacterium]